MRGLGRTNSGKFWSDKKQAQRSAKSQMELMLSNSHVFDAIKKRGGGKSGAELKAIVTELNKLPVEMLTNKQLSYIAAIYDKFMDAWIKGGEL